MRLLMLLLGLIRNTCSSFSSLPASLYLPSTCIHHFAYMMYCWISKLCCHQGSLGPLMAYAAAYGAVCVPSMCLAPSLPLSLCLSGVSVCLCLNVSAEKQKHWATATATTKRNNDNKGDRQMALLPGKSGTSPATARQGKTRRCDP